MLLRCVIAVLTSGLALEAVASPLVRESVKERRVPSTHTLHERHVPKLVRHWAKRDKVPDSAMLPMRIGLKQVNEEAGHDRLMDISNHASPNYGKYMTAEEVIDFFAPPEASVTTVIDWVVSSGIARERISHSVNKQWIQFDATAEEAGNLLITDFFVWEHADGSTDISAEEYHVPMHIQEHIDYITPGTRLRSRVNEKRASLTTGAEKRDIKGHAKAFYVTPNAGSLVAPVTNSTSCDYYITAECIRNQYDIPNGTTAAVGNELGIFEHLDQHYSRKDLDEFFATLYPYIPSGWYPIEDLIDGAVGAVEDPSEIPAAYGLEAALDFDAAMPLIYPQTSVLFQEDDEYYESTGNFTGFWNTFLDAIDGSYCTYSAYGETGDCVDPACADPVYPDPNPGGYKGTRQCGVYKPTNVISISYGAWGYPDNYMKRQCNEWMKLGLQGVTIVVSSGDSGVGDEEYCYPGPDGLIFEPTDASECPYVLSVGSTQFDRFNTSAPPTPWEKLNEISTTRFASGSGFSNIFGVPSWQKSAISAYFDQVDLPFSGYHHYVVDGNFSSVKGGVFHHGGRAYPDIAAIGDRQVVLQDGIWYRVGGTSLSAPVVGSILTLVNERRIAEGKTSVGYLNPTLYAHPEVFHDITVGSSPGCNSTGFVCASGWDPVSGLGSINYPAFEELLLGL